jgi:hypothetical protein
MFAVRACVMQISWPDCMAAAAVRNCSCPAPSPRIRYLTRAMQAAGMGGEYTGALLSLVLHLVHRLPLPIDAEFAGFVVAAESFDWCEV